MEKLIAILRKSAPLFVLGGLLGAVILSLYEKNDAAGFLLVGATLSYVVLGPAPLLELALGPLKVRYQEKIEVVETIIARLRQSSLSLARAVSEVVINTGGEKYVGGFGEAAQFIIYENLRSLLIANDVPYQKELGTFRRRLLLDYLYAIVGEKRVAKGAGAIMTRLKESDFSELPTVTELRTLTIKDGIKSEWLDRVLAAYRSLHEDWKITDMDMAEKLYEFKNRQDA